MNRLEFIERMLLSVQYKGIEFSADIVLNDNKFIVESVKCESAMTGLGVQGNDSTITITAQGYRLYDAALDIYLEDGYNDIAGTLLSAIVSALEVKLDELRCEVEASIGVSKYTSTLISLNNTLADISSKLAKVQFLDLTISNNDCKANYELSLANSENISLTIAVSDENANIDLIMYDVPAVKAELNINLNDELSTIMTNFITAIVGSFNIYIDLTAIISTMTSMAYPTDSFIELNDSLIQAALNAYREAMLVDYNLTRLLDLDPNTLSRLDKIYLEV